MEKSGKQRVIKWVKQVLKDQGLKEINVDFPDCNPTGGFISDMTFVNVTGERRGRKETLHLIIKKSKDSFTAYDDTSFQYAYSNEINMYSKFIPYFQNFTKEKKLKPFENLPHCYGTIAEGDQYVIILENLEPKGFQMHDIRKPIDSNHSKLMLEAYAHWHALNFALKDQQPKIFQEFAECNKGIAGTKILDFAVETNTKEIDFVLKVYQQQEKIETHIIEKLKMLMDSYADLLQEICSVENDDYLVIVHGDSWNNNFLFHYITEDTNPDSVVIIDWQLASLGSPLGDVAAIIFSGSSRKELEHIDDLLDFYYNTLSKKLIELGSDPTSCFPKDFFLKTFKKYAPFGIAAMPYIAKMAFSNDADSTVDIDQVLREGNFNCLFDGEMRNPDEYFNRVDGVLEFCIERGFL